jgi:pyruvate dehydrogenase E1 component alpha subunit
MVQERTLPKFQAKAAALTAEEGLVIYEDMVLGRYFEDKCAEMYYRGKMFGFVHLYNGQEAVSSGVIKACVRTTTCAVPTATTSTPLALAYRPKT